VSKRMGYMPFSRYDRRPEYLRQMPHGWRLDVYEYAPTPMGWAVTVVSLAGAVALALWG